MRAHVGLIGFPFILKGGKFDHPNRLFHSVESTWAGCLESSTNVKELIPEFFYLPEMFENANDYNLGCLEDGTKLGDVVLPPWADSPEEFVRIHRQVNQPSHSISFLCNCLPPCRRWNRSWCPVSCTNGSTSSSATNNAVQKRSRLQMSSITSPTRAVSIGTR